MTKHLPECVGGRIVLCLPLLLFAAQAGAETAMNITATRPFVDVQHRCGQSPTSIRALLSQGYSAHKTKWYRAGIQSWKQFGLTTVKPRD